VPFIPAINALNFLQSSTVNRLAVSIGCAKSILLQTSGSPDTP